MVYFSNDIKYGINNYAIGHYEVIMAGEVTFLCRKREGDTTESRLGNRKDLVNESMIETYEVSNLRKS